MKRRFPTILAITVTFLFAVLATNRLDWTDSSTFLTSLDLRWLDTKFQLRGRLVPGDEVIIVGLDDRTMDSLGSARTFERKHVPALIDQISAAGPRVIGFDILYEDEDASDPRNDALFAEAIERAGNVVLAVRLDLESTTGESGERQELDPDFQELVVQKQVFPAVRQRGTNTGASMIQGYDLSMNLPIHNQPLPRSASSISIPMPRDSCVISHSSSSGAAASTRRWTSSCSSFTWERPRSPLRCRTTGSSRSRWATT